MNTTDIVLAATPLISLGITAGLRALMPKIPGWALPILAALVGIAPDWIAHLQTGSPANSLMAALLGLAATGIHQIAVQLKKP